MESKLARTQLALPIGYNSSLWNDFIGGRILRIFA
jgi:hypothetical protein